MPDDAPLILRDVLALDRTSLANERTLLAYIRTAAGLVAGGIGLTHFVPETWALLVGWASAVVGIVTALIGIWRFVSIQRRIHQEMILVPPK